ncbi:hypothetical protein BCR43DRAFT_485836 [Syncephalastrum racemosum]|uniref:Uncharacterized protein n=1 Tax=Syncephalastrum racemosum TaxID=13706 RepID=A0A1X2HN59_SYNRA|nr:hypothetical protein BCR43DRAFT_485836 [Syncephalastrum racemosum]
MYGDDEYDQDGDYGGRYTPLSTTSSAKYQYQSPSQQQQQQQQQKGAYRISFRSVDDDELQRLMRSLVTPVPASSASVAASDSHSQNIMNHNQPYYRYGNSDHNNNHNNSTSRRGPNVPYRDELQETDYGRSESPRRAYSRSESVALFKQLNNEEDNASLDLLKSDLQEWMDPSLLDLLSRPSSRAPSTVSENYYHQHQQQQQQQQQQQRSRHAASPPLCPAPAAEAIEPPPVLATPALRPKKVSTDTVTMANRAKGHYDPSVRRRSHALLNESAEKTRQLLDAVEQSFLAEEARPPSPPPQSHRRPMKEIHEDGLAKKPSRLDAILALRRDSDALLERRLSLLKKRADSLLGSSSGSEASGTTSTAGRRRWSTYTGGDADLLPATSSAAAATTTIMPITHTTFSPSPSRRVRTISLPGTDSGTAERLPHTAPRQPLDIAFSEDELSTAEEDMSRAMDRFSIASSSPQMATTRRLEPHYEEDPIDDTPRMAPRHISKLYTPSRRLHDEEWQSLASTQRVQEPVRPVEPERLDEEEHTTPKLLPETRQTISLRQTRSRRATLGTTEDKTLVLIPKRSYKDASRKAHADQEKPRLVSKRTSLANPSKEAGVSSVNMNNRRRGGHEQDASPTLLPRRARRYTQSTASPQPQLPLPSQQRRRATVTQHYEERGEDKSVAESAKDILATIRERRRRSTAFDF